MADRLRQQRAVKQIELDSGWWEDRDLTIAHRSWFRLDVRGLLEDHGGGQCLHRVAVRSRLTTAAGLPLLLAFAVAWALRYLGVSWPVAVPVVAVTALVYAVASVLSTSRLVLEAVDAVAAASGMLPLPKHNAHAGAVGSASTPTESAGFTLTTTRAIADETTASQALVGDL
jgi:hypothetical protein